MDSHHITILKKFISNTCSIEELQEAEQLLKTGIPDTIWLMLMEEVQQENNTKNLAEDHKIKLYNVISLKINRPSGKQISFQRNGWSIGIAASILLFITLTLVLYRVNQTNEIESITTLEQKKLRLEDGSDVWVNNKTSMRYPDHFKNEVREVSLKGEAFFNVAKELNRPFVVTTQGIQIQVLGTSFNVKSYDEDEDVIVTLATGKVQVKINQKTQMLLPGQQLRFHKATKTYDLLQVDASEFYTWRDGWLSFASVRLADVSKIISRQYNVKVVIESEPLRDIQITLKYKSKNLKDLLEILAYTASFDYKMKNNTIVIRSKQK